MEQGRFIGGAGQTVKPGRPRLQTINRKGLATDGEHMNGRFVIFWLQPYAY